MSKYYITYSVDAYTFIDAENETQARDKFINGEYEDIETGVNLHNIELNNNESE